jgi:Flagellar transcriptional activator (FlhC)
MTPTLNPAFRARSISATLILTGISLAKDSEVRSAGVSPFQTWPFEPEGNQTMRITDDRYHRDRERHDLALRMIHHEARTCTIRSCTGLSDDRIRKLYKTYVSKRHSASIKRRRGKSPRQIGYFTRNLTTHVESSILGALYVQFDLLSPADGTRSLYARSIRAAQTFCDAYETHCQFHHDAHISFEHAWFLLESLRGRRELQMLRCMHCDGTFVDEAVACAQRPCPICKAKQNRRGRRVLPTPDRRSLNGMALAPTVAVEVQHAASSTDCGC